ncbi:MAG TPA: hypothetical protein VE913_00890, partial [Longimicrobium sp.]|nr:hypothetical protein [Longimicrobium sp.]
HQTPYTDSTVTVTKMRISPTQERFDVLLPSGTTVPISGPYAPAQQTGLEARPCVTWRVNDPTKQSCVEFAPDSYRDSVTTRHTVAFSPAGDYVVLAISRDSLAYDVGAVQGDGTYFHRPHGPHEETIGTLLWIIPVRGGANFGPIKVPERVEALGLSEEGRYLVLQTRNLFFKGTTTGASSGMTFTKHNICSAEFRRTGGAASLFSPTTSPPFNSTSPCVPGSTFSP